MNELTVILDSIGRGDRQAAARLLPLVYDELRKLAAARLQNERPGQTLQATALVHDAYLRLVGERDVWSQSPLAFSGTVATFLSGRSNGFASSFPANTNWGDGVTSDGTVTKLVMSNDSYSVACGHDYRAARST